MAALEIRPYQAEGIDFLADARRAALFDRPGLGKTMQSLLAMDYLVGAGARILVIATGDAVGVWRDEIAKWLDVEAAVYAGPRADRVALDHEGPVVVNYHRLGTAIAQGGWHGVIFDESQTLRNRKTRTLFVEVRQHFDDQRTRLGRLPVFFLSGTPIVKSTGDIWPILHLIDKRRWNSYWQFVQKYAIVWQDQFGWHVDGVTNLKGLWQETSDVVLRRTEGEVPLPPKVRQRIPLTMTAPQAAAYKQMERQMFAEITDGSLLLAPNALAREMRLRQLLVCPRLVGVEDDGAALHALRDIAGRSPDPFVVFTPFTEALPYAVGVLRPTGRSVFTVSGGMGQKFHREVEAFKAAARANEAPVLIANVQMSKSWSVAEVTHEAYMLGVDWNDTTMDQAESRLHRDGQRDTTFSRYFVHEHTHDYDSLDILAGKRRLADAILDRKIPRRFR